MNKIKFTNSQTETINELKEVYEIMSIDSVLRTVSVALAYAGEYVCTVFIGPRGKQTKY